MAYAKAVVPMVVMGILAVLGQFGVTGEMTVNEALVFGVTSLLVYLVPNRAK